MVFSKSLSTEDGFNDDISIEDHNMLKIEYLWIALGKVLSSSKNENKVWDWK